LIGSGEDAAQDAGHPRGRVENDLAVGRAPNEQSYGHQARSPNSTTLTPLLFVMTIPVEL
jgi:hypothetical protein